MPYTDDGEYYWISDGGYVYFGCHLSPVETDADTDTDSP